MPPRSKIDQLPDEVRAALDRKLIEDGFRNYVELAAWLTEQGYAIGKSAVGAYGQNLQRRLDAIRASTEAARLIAQAAPDDADERSNAIISLVQTEIFESLLALQEASEEADPATRVELLGKAAKNIATLTRASVARNKWSAEVRKKVEAAAADVDEAARALGLSDEGARKIREKVMGIL
jgi:hypothetical protein